jgi:hypothetical protein
MDSARRDRTIVSLSLSLSLCLGVTLALQWV